MIRKSFGLVFVALLIPALAGAGPIRSLYVIGDSLSDQGNAFVLTGGFPPPPYAQRASNGPVAVERLAAALGLSLAPAALGGTNYAVVGATTGPVLIPSSNPPATTENVSATSYGLTALDKTGLLSQVVEVLKSPIPDPAGALFVIWGGANDLSLNPSLTTAANAVNNLLTAITTLYAGGVRQFLVPNLPDLSRTPAAQPLPLAQRAQLQLLTIGFNTGLATGLTSLSALPGISITPFDTFAFFNAVLGSPASFGFTNATSPCLTGDLATGGSICADPSSYVFWDSLHPTTAADRVLGNAFAAAVPEPATLTLVGLGTGLAAIVRRRRSAA